MKVLVSAGSKHGATAEIADRIAAVLRASGLEVTVSTPDQAENLEDYDAVVLGSAVYAGHWRDDAKRLAARIVDAEATPLIWLFSSGPLGDEPLPDEDPVDVSDLVEALEPIDHHLFSGAADKDELTFGERAVMAAVRASYGDFRDWDEITAWSEGIAAELGHMVPQHH